MKMLTNNKKLINKCLTGAILALLFLMLYKSPIRLDDWAWGGFRGLKRLTNWFNDYNGRYFSNIFVIAMLRLPKVIRVALEIGILFSISKLLSLIISDKKIYLLSVVLICMLPVSIVSQTITWVSGFCVYSLSLLFVLLFYYVCVQIYLKDKKIKNWQFFLLCLSVFIGQLILETGTLFTIYVFLVTNFLYYKKYKHWNKELLILLISSILGAFVMFSNSSYSELTNIETSRYKRIKMSDTMTGTLLRWWDAYKTKIVPQWMKNNYIVNLALVVSLMIFINNNFKKYKTLFIIACIFFLSFFSYNTIDFVWTNTDLKGDGVFAIISMLFGIFVLFAIYFSNLEKSKKDELFLCAFSQVILMGPLIIIKPINARCFFHTYIFWVLLISLFIIHGVNKNILQIPNYSIYIKVFIVLIMLISICNQSISWKVDKERKLAIENGLSTNADLILIPKVPYSYSYSYGCNISNKNEFWKDSFREYYNIPNEVEIELIDYYEYLKQKNN